MVAALQSNAAAQGLPAPMFIGLWPEGIWSWARLAGACLGGHT